MKVSLNIPDYSPDMGMVLNWENDGAELRAFKKAVLRNQDYYLKKGITNTEGLISLANHFLNLAQNSVPTGTHIHFDKFNSLEDDSLELLIEKI